MIVATSAAQRQELEQYVGAVRTFMRKHALVLADLTGVGGKDLNSPDPDIAQEARSVEKCWELMAKLGLKHIDLEGPVSRIQSGAECTPQHEKLRNAQKQGQKAEKRPPNRPSRRLSKKVQKDQ